MIKMALEQYRTGSPDLLLKLLEEAAFTDNERLTYGYELAVAAINTSDVSLYSLAAKNKFPIWSSFPDILYIDNPEISLSFARVWLSCVDNINGRLDEDLTTPLMLAAAASKSDLVVKLLENHADPTLNDRHGQSALFFAVCVKDRPSIDLLMSKSTADQIKYAFIQALQNKSIDIIEMFPLPDIDHLSDCDGLIPILLVESLDKYVFNKIISILSIRDKTIVLYKYIDLLQSGSIKILLELGADVNMLDSNLESALDLAIKTDNIDIIRMVWDKSSVENRESSRLNLRP